MASENHELFRAALAEVFALDRDAISLEITSDGSDGADRKTGFQSIISEIIVNLKSADAAETRPVRLVLKTLPARGSFIRNLVEESRAFEKEVHVYDELELLSNPRNGEPLSAAKVSNEPPKFFPRLVLSSSLKSRRVPVVSELLDLVGPFALMRDESAFGFRMLDKRLGLNPGQISASLRAVAKFHGTFLAQKFALGETEFRKRHEVLAHESCSAYGFVFEGVFEKTAGVVGGDSGGKLTEFVGKNVPGGSFDFFLSSLEKWKKHPLSCVCHGDFFTSNILFEDAAETRAVLIDFQGARLAHPVIDLVYLFVTSASPDDRRENLSRWLEEYLDALKKETSSGMSLEDSANSSSEYAAFVRSYTLEKLVSEFREAFNSYGLIVGCALIPLILENPDEGTSDYSNEECIKAYLSGDSAEGRGRRNRKVVDWLAGLLDDVFLRV